MTEEEEPATESPPASENASASEKPRKVRLQWLHYLYEFIIVVMGISVPFLLDRWNQNIQDQHAGQQVYRNLQRELEEDLQDLQNIIRQNNRSLDKFNFGAGLIRDGAREQLDTLVQIALDMSDISDFHRNSTVYETLINSGDVRLMDNRLILSRLHDLEDWYIYMNRLENNHLSVFIDLILPKLIRHMELETGQALDADWFYDFDLSNLLQVSIHLCEEKREVYSKVEQNIVELQKLLLEEVGG